MSTLRGEAVDRPPVCFYELNGLDEELTNDDPFNIYSHPSWAPLIELACEKTDRIVMREVPFKNAPPEASAELTEIEKHYDEKGSLYKTRTVRVGSSVLTKRTRRDRDVNTIWVLEPLLKDVEDVKKWLEIPVPEFGGVPDTSDVLKTEQILGDTGIVMVDTADPLCLAAGLFDMGTFTIIAMTEPKLFHQVLERFAGILQQKIEAIAKAVPGRLWRIYGPEYASPPYLPPRLFREYVVKYDTPLVEAIQRHGGFARIHCHGNLKDILDDIVSTGCMGLDPIEPPPQGDVELLYVREKYGRQLVLFGNIEVSDIVNLNTTDFEKKVVTALREGTAGEGRGFLLMPSAAPYGRVLSPLALKNYEKMIEVVERL